MANISIAMFLDGPNTIVANPSTSSVAVTGLKRGVVYRVVAATTCYINYGAAAAVNTGVMIPANTPTFMVFGGADSQGTDLDVRVFATGSVFVHFTPCFAIPTV